MLLNNLQVRFVSSPFATRILCYIVDEAPITWRLPTAELIVN